ncbi:MAG: CatB-related O-acetyltransferase [Pseudorhodobacter sp.]|nr:CatB-related O-acetyltransferase [Rhizobacter sp.]
MLFSKKKFKPAKTLKQRHPEWDVGRHSYGDPQLHDWGEGAKLRIGAFCSFASGVQIFMGGEHRMDWVSTYPFSAMWANASHFMGHPSTKGNVSIGNDVWIGAEAMVLSGVSIGDGAVIGARALVTKDVQPYAVVAGNPARQVKRRFTDSQVDRLLAVAWWHWQEDRIASLLPLILANDVEGFLRAAESESESDNV